MLLDAGFGGDVTTLAGASFPPFRAVISLTVRAAEVKWSVPILISSYPASRA
jgi:hypothetical protein